MATGTEARNDFEKALGVVQALLTPNMGDARLPMAQRVERRLYMGCTGPPCEWVNLGNWHGTSESYLHSL